MDQDPKTWPAFLVQADHRCFVFKFGEHFYAVPQGNSSVFDSVFGFHEQACVA